MKFLRISFSIFLTHNFKGGQSTWHGSHQVKQIRFYVQWKIYDNNKCNKRASSFVISYKRPLKRNPWKYAAFTSQHSMKCAIWYCNTANMCWSVRERQQCFSKCCVCRCRVNCICSRCLCALNACDNNSQKYRNCATWHKYHVLCHQRKCYANEARQRQTRLEKSEAN